MLDVRSYLNPGRRILCCFLGSSSLIIFIIHRQLGWEKKISVFSLCSLFRILNEEIFGKRVSQILNHLSEGAGKAQYGNCGEPKADRSLDYNSEGVGSHPQTATMFVPLARTHPHFLNSSLRSPGVLRAQLENHQFNPTSMT